MFAIRIWFHPIMSKSTGGFFVHFDLGHVQTKGKGDVHGLVQVYDAVHDLNRFQSVKRTPRKTHLAKRPRRPLRRWWWW